jgi:hypothetical protein
VTTQVHLEVDAAGALTARSFDPPLAPPVEGCLRDGLGAFTSMKVPAGGYDLSLTLVGRR